MFNSLRFQGAIRAVSTDAPSDLGLAIVNPTDGPETSETKRQTGPDQKVVFRMHDDRPRTLYDSGSIEKNNEVACLHPK